MKTNLKTIAALAVIGAASIGMVTPSLAASQNTQALRIMPATKAERVMPAKHHAKHEVVRVTKIVRVIKVGKHQRAWKLGLRRNLHLSSTDARTITKAALLMRGKKHISVGKIEPVVAKRGMKMYRIQLVNKNNRVVKSVLLNSRNGHIRPMRLRPAAK